MVNLVQLVASVGPALVPVNEAARASVEISGIHISELKDPTPYLEGGEALLTTGMPFIGAGSREYVGRLRDRGVGALVFGLGPNFDKVPAGLAKHCSEAGLPLLIVPVDQPFIRVTRGFWELVAASGRATLVAQIGTQTALVRAVGKPDGVAEVVSLVAQAVGGWAAYLPLNGGEPVIWPEGLSGVIPGLQPEVRRFAERGNVGAATFPLHGYDVIAHPVGSGLQVHGAFAVGLGRRPSPADRHLILTATALLGLRERAQSDAASIARTVDEAVVNLLLNGEVSAAQALVETTGSRALPATVRVFAFPLANDKQGQQAAIARPDGIVGDLVHGGMISTSAAERSRPARVSSLNGMGLLLLSGPLASDELPEAESSVRGSELCGALSEAVRLGEFGGAAAIAMRRARDAIGGEVVAARRLSGIDEGERAAERLAAYTRAPLVETVRSYLRHRGGWEAAARELGVHRNTIRNRIRIVETELGIDLNDPDLSAELWLALRPRG